MNIFYRSSALLTSLLLPTLAFAHSGSIGHSHFHNTFFEGLIHPITGTDHLIALLFAGALLAQGTLRNKIGGIVVLLAALLAGAGVGVLLGASVVVEYLIIGSCVLLALWLWQSGKLSFNALQRLSVLALIIAIHGWAHGAELPATGATLFIAGFLLAAALLMLTGMLASQLLQGIRKRHLSSKAA